MISATIVEESTILGTDELGRLCQVDTRRILELIDEGILDASASPDGGWRFGPTSLRRARLALRLQSDLGVNLQGAALAVDLLEEIAALRRELALTR